MIGVFSFLDQTVVDLFRYIFLKIRAVYLSKTTMYCSKSCQMFECHTYYCCDAIITSQHYDVTIHLSEDNPGKTAQTFGEPCVNVFCGKFLWQFSEFLFFQVYSTSG